MKTRFSLYFFPLVFTILSLLSLCCTGDSGGKGSAICSLEECGRRFVNRPSGVEGPNRAYCQHLQQYVTCVVAMETSCRGDLGFHTTAKVLETLMEKNHCDHLLAAVVAPENSNSLMMPHQINENSALSASSSPPPQDHCDYQGESSHSALCGLFGDPHLRTFSGEFMTCGVRGAWPLLSNKHLIIQVTNEPVGEQGTATAVTKVTVLIKGNETCGGEKTYEASSDALPRAFVDGTTSAGGEERPAVGVIEAIPGEHVVVTVRKIAAVVTIKKNGRYLSVSVTVPQSLKETTQKEGLQLCGVGCPVSERLPRKHPHGFKPAMEEKKAVTLCVEANVTDFYLDSCVFDLLATGQVEFIRAAIQAQNELWTHAPRAAAATLGNCSK